MAQLRSGLRVALYEYGQALPTADPVQIGGCLAAVSALSSNPSLADLATEADRLLSPNATPFERGVLMGAALVIALAPVE